MLNSKNYQIMKSLNKYIGIALMAGALTVTTSCSDSFLQEDSLTESSSTTFWKTSNDAMMALTACYDGLQSTQLYDGGPWNLGPLNMDCISDNGGHFNWSGWRSEERRVGKECRSRWSPD